MKKIAIGVAALIVIVVLVMLALPHIIDVNQYRGEIQAQLQNRLNRSVKLGAMSLAVFPLRVQVQDVTIGEDPRYKSNLPFADIGEMDLSVKLLPLLSKSIAIDSLTLKRPKIELIKDQAGVWNFASLGEAPAAPAPGGAPAAAQAKPPANAPDSRTSSRGKQWQLVCSR